VLYLAVIVLLAADSVRAAVLLAFGAALLTFYLACRIPLGAAPRLRLSRLRLRRNRQLVQTTPGHWRRAE
jgi:hypothetical protein